MTVLVVLDGVGLAAFDPSRNAVRPDTLPTLFDAMATYGYRRLDASGPAVGLEAGQAGNSEIGHLSIGAGRPLATKLAEFEGKCRDGSFHTHRLWSCFEAGGAVHIVGLVSDAGTHGHWRTISRFAAAAAENGLSPVVHCVLDGIDSQSGTAPALLQSLKASLSHVQNVTFGIVIGRKWFCDRSGNTALSEFFSSALEQAETLPKFTDAELLEHLAQSTEAIFPPHAISFVPRNGAPVIMVQNREDRARQAAVALSCHGKVFSLIDLDGVVPVEHAFYPKSPLDFGLHKVFLEKNIQTLRVSETCKFPHVTFFFNGLNEGQTKDGICVTSFPEDELADHPEMRAKEIADHAEHGIEDHNNALVIVNLPNMDQIGHLGRMDLAEAAATHVDSALARILQSARGADRSVVILADHGNAEKLADDQGQPFGSHTTNPVPFCVVPAPSVRVDLRQQEQGSLVHVAASVLDIMGLEVPEGFYPSMVNVSPNLATQTEDQRRVSELEN